MRQQVINDQRNVEASLEFSADLQYTPVNSYIVVHVTQVREVAMLDLLMAER
jgi:hypothetical protein